ncbi:hypothetical protein EI533_20505 [Pseudomonas donghuensis]|nr:hypothetical protein [Pseudomonas donghuensis]
MGRSATIAGKPAPTGFGDDPVGAGLPAMRPVQIGDCASSDSCDVRYPLTVPEPPRCAPPYPAPPSPC